MEFKDLIKKERENKKISAYKIGKDIGISRTTIIKYENGEIGPTLKNAEKICNYLKLTYVIGEKEWNYETVWSNNWRNRWA